MSVTSNFIRLGCNNRPGYKLKSIRGLIIHYIGVAQKSAEVIRNNFENTTRYGATQYVCDYNTGNIIQTMPEDEVAYHCGANVYRPLKNQICGNDNPNYYLVGIETCIESVENSRPSDIQWNSLVEFAANFLKRHGLAVDNLYLHNEIAPTNCYKYFIENPGEWQKFKNDVQNKLNPQIIAENKMNNSVIKIVYPSDKTGLNIRVGAGTNYAKIGAIAYGQPINIYEIAGDWGKTEKGWVCLIYAKENIKQEVLINIKKYSLGRYKVNTPSGVNVRAGAGTNFKIKKGYINGTIFDVFEISNNWGRSPSGWVCLDYAIKI